MQFYHSPEVGDTGGNRKTDVQAMSYSGQESAKNMSLSDDTVNTAIMKQQMLLDWALYTNELEFE